jgi:hypothetical protein
MIAQMLPFLGRAAREPILHSAVALATIPVTASTLHAAGVTNELDATSLASGLLQASLWLTLGMAALFGGLGGVVAELISLHGNVEMPHRHHGRRRTSKRSNLAQPHNEVDLGIVSRIFLGATAALALLAVFSPPSATSLIVNALIAGSAATGVFRLVQGRMLGKLQEGQPRKSARQVGAAGAQPSAWIKSRTSAVHPKSTAPSPSAV